MKLSEYTDLTVKQKLPRGFRKGMFLSNYERAMMLLYQYHDYMKNGGDNGEE